MKFPEPLNQLSDEHHAFLEPFLQPVTFAEGSLIFEINTPGDSCYIIEDGTVRLEVPPEGSNPDDHENILNYIGAGTILGELALLDKLPRSATAFAHTDVKAYRLSTQGLEALVRSHPEVAGTIYAALGRDASLKLRALTDRLAGFIFKADNPMVDDMVARAVAAQREFKAWSDEQIDGLLLALAQIIADHASELAALNVEETNIGNVPDKINKIQVGSLGVYRALSGHVGGGFDPADSTKTVIDIIDPVGVVFGLVPVTNPVSTFIFKVLICLKARNAVILSSSRRALRTATRTGELVQEVLEAYSAPVDIVQWVRERNSRKTTADFMGHEDVSLILATGGPSMVKAAYSSGTPAIGVGPGNAPVFVAADADIDHAVERIISSKTYDNGVVCASEHNLVVDRRVRDAFVSTLEQAGTAILKPEEKETFTARAVDAETNHFIADIIGQDAATIAEMTGIQRDYPIKLIVVPVDSVQPGDVFAREKLAPVLSLYMVSSADEGIQVCQQLLHIDGNGHTAIIYSKDEQLIKRFGLEMPASRILVNAPGAQASIGAVSALTPSLTLGCGTFGGTSTTDNVTYRHLTNTKRLVYYAPEESILTGL